MNTFWWSKLHHDKGGVKLHTLYDVQSDIPLFNIITNANVHDSQVMDSIPYNRGDYYIFDRGYMDAMQLNTINTIGGFFVVREKHKMKYKVVKDFNHNTPETGIMSDQLILFDGQQTKKRYSSQIRRVVYYDKEGNRTFVFYTNAMDTTPEMVALLYKYRCRVELFFKWLKQHLHIKEFYGTSENAVKIQIYCAIIAYCLVAIIERRMNIETSTYEMLRVLSLALLVRMPLRDLLETSPKETNYQNVIQLTLIFFSGH